MGVLLKS